MKPSRTVGIIAAIASCILWPFLFIMAALTTDNWRTGAKLLNGLIKELFTGKSTL